MIRLAVLLTLALAVPAAAQDKNPKNDPGTCPYCLNDPVLMKAAGIVSHGGFEFGHIDTDGVDSLLPNADIRWIETEHFEIGYGGAPGRVPSKLRKKYLAELTELSLVMPEIKPKTKVLDTWLLAHMYAARTEQIWDQFVELMEVDLSVMNDGQVKWNGQGLYHGEGPYMGQKGKYELLIVPAEGHLVAYIKDQFGLQTKLTSRWNVMARDSIAVTIHQGQGDLKKDIALWGHVAFNLAHNLLDGYEHYSYETPVWIHEGLAHYFERNIDPNFNTFDSGEGAPPIRTSKSDWESLVKKMVKSKKAPRMANLIALRGYAELTLEDHLATWSMVTFLFEEHRTGFANLNKELHGRLLASGVVDSQNLPKVHRESFKKELGMTYAQFDQAWTNWVLGIVPKEEEDAKGGTKR